jgi:hypothetical protein
MDELSPSSDSTNSSVPIRNRVLRLYVCFMKVEYGEREGVAEDGFYHNMYDCKA